MSELMDTGDFDVGEKQAYDRLIDGKDVRYKSSYTYEQRVCLAILEDAYKYFKAKGITINSLKHFTDGFIDLGPSEDRKSRSEVVESLKAKIDFLEKQNLTNQQNNQIR